MIPPLSKTASACTLTNAQVRDLIEEACPAKDYRDKKVLLIVPDGTRSAPVGLLFQTLHRQMGEVTKTFDVLIALGTHQAMSETAILSRERHIVYKESPFRTILSCAPKMYDEVWTGGKAMYKLEPVLDDGGELIIYALHIAEVCVAHGKVIEE